MYGFYLNRFRRGVNKRSIYRMMAIMLCICLFKCYKSKCLDSQNVFFDCLILPHLRKCMQTYTTYKGLNTVVMGYGAK